MSDTMIDNSIGSIPCDVCGRTVAEHDRRERLDCIECGENTPVEQLDADQWCERCVDGAES